MSSSSLAACEGAPAKSGCPGCQCTEGASPHVVASYACPLSQRSDAKFIGRIRHAWLCQSTSCKPDIISNAAFARARIRIMLPPRRFNRYTTDTLQQKQLQIYCCVRKQRRTMIRFKFPKKHFTAASDLIKQAASSQMLPKSPSTKFSCPCQNQTDYFGFHEGHQECLSCDCR